MYIYTSKRESSAFMQLAELLRVGEVQTRMLDWLLTKTLHFVNVKVYTAILDAAYDP